MNVFIALKGSHFWFSFVCLSGQQIAWACFHNSLLCKPVQQTSRKFQTNHEVFLDRKGALTLYKVLPPLAPLFRSQLEFLRGYLAQDTQLEHRPYQTKNLPCIFHLCKNRARNPFRMQLNLNLSRVVITTPTGHRCLTLQLAINHLYFLNTHVPYIVPGAVARSDVRPPGMRTVASSILTSSKHFSVEIWLWKKICDQL